MSMDEVIRIAEKAPKRGNETTMDKVVNFLQQQQKIVKRREEEKKQKILQEMVMEQ